ncbi:hypothetical protein H4582DRAFT_2079865 [Lactarius indigo]|nr:hypothetical protein H4582DRAFT_2079865 [Lactarius indigo]
MACAELPVLPSFPRMSEMSPSVPTKIILLSARSSFQTRPTRARTSIPALSNPVHACTSTTTNPPRKPRLARHQLPVFTRVLKRLAPPHNSHG